MSIVLDASMAIAWMFDDENTPKAKEVLLAITQEGAIVPALWHLEVANVLRNAVRRRRCDEAYADRCIERLTHLPVKVDPETDLHAWTKTRDMARSNGLTLYDAAYLELAVRLGLSIATADVDLAAAATRCGLQVMAP